MRYMNTNKSIVPPAINEISRDDNPNICCLSARLVPWEEAGVINRPKCRHQGMLYSWVSFENYSTKSISPPFVRELCKASVFTFHPPLFLQPKPKTRHADGYAHLTDREPINPNQSTRNPKPETRNPKPETRNPKPETRNPKPETRNPKPETRNPKPETRNPKPY